MLKKIISVKNVGRFRNSAASGNPQLTKHVFIFGPNGSGKTTLCAVLRSLHTGDGAYVTGRQTLGAQDPATVDLLLENGNARFEGGVWTGATTPFAFYDGTYVAENVHAGEVVDTSQRRNLYRVIIGAVGARLAREDEQLAADSRAKTSEITAKTREISVHVPAGMTVDKFLELSPVEKVDEAIEAQTRVVGSAAKADAIQERSALVGYDVPSQLQSLELLLAKTLDDVAENAETILATHLVKHGLQTQRQWIAGKVDALDSDCPFCGQDIGGLELIRAYRTLFGREFKALNADLEALKRDVEQAFSERAIANLELASMRNTSALEFWSKHVSSPTGTVALPEDVIVAMRSARKAAVGLIEQKISSPTKAIALQASDRAILDQFKTAAEKVSSINAMIASINGAIDEAKVRAASVDLAAEEAVLSGLRAAKSRHAPEVANLCADLSQLNELKAAIDLRKAEVRGELNTYVQDVLRPYEARINELLDAFNAGFRIAETKHAFPGGYASSSYQLVINGKLVELGDSDTGADRPSFRNTLSGGDRSTLALAFFIASQEKDPALADTTVVFDDPFHSQDAFRRRQTVHEIIKTAAACKQIFVLSHDAGFLKQVWDKSPPASRVSLALTDHRAAGSKLLQSDLDRAVQGRTATDIDDLQAYLTTGVGEPLDLVRKMRVVLETYCRTTYYASFSPDDWLGDMVGKIRSGGDAHPAHALYDELDQINDYSKEYHHGEDVNDVSRAAIDQIELSGFVRRCLRIVNALPA